jgi:hypothetical protein
MALKLSTVDIGVGEGEGDGEGDGVGEGEGDGEGVGVAKFRMGLETPLAIVAAPPHAATDPNRRAAAPHARKAAFGTKASYAPGTMNSARATGGPSSPTDRIFHSDRARLARRRRDAQGGRRDACRTGRRLHEE